MRNLHWARKRLPQPMQRRDGCSTLARLLERPRYEVLPTPDITARVTEHLPAGRIVTVTASPARGLDATLETTERLSQAGFTVVPHLAARMVADRAHLLDIVARLQSLGIRQIFVPSGDSDTPGDYPDAFSLLGELESLGRPFAAMGVTAYPESHPIVSDDRVIQAMWDKRHLATELVSNLTFDPRIVATWLTRVRARGVELPLWLGIPGAVSSARLVAMATRIGVGDSTRYLMKHPGVVARLAGPREFSAEKFLRHLAPTLARPDAAVAGLHIFTFNQVAETENWRVELATRLQEGGGLPR
ncbi:methylenetetrahydrofolate reductase [Demetria terragena]|uniref:methylenetetrahydrofolate reductase n=1 Tax=Demetria terragena TaxID=63959 RepID=UPI00037D424E|nr:methylenetetrahydrofolate reductase [Demetria terragena]